MASVTVSAPVNIAVLKYWGKRDVPLNLPTNSSISVTLSQKDLRTVTTAACSAEVLEDELVLGGKHETVKGSRIEALFNQLRHLRESQEKNDPQLAKLSGLKLRLTSENNFPTAAGLASSAAGFAALVFAVAKLYQLPHSESELSVLARQGSGSACRSLYGGYVAWQMGSAPDGSDSRAVQIAPESHWPEMRAAILVASAKKKDVSSTAGMQATVASSTLFAHRAHSVVPQRYSEFVQAILAKDFTTFARLTMQDSNQFHAVCLDTWPPILYLNDASRAAIRVVEDLNRMCGPEQLIAAYTFDAGPNAVIYYLATHEDLVMAPLRSVLGHLSGWDGCRVQQRVPEQMDKRHLAVLATGIERVILTGVGPGPQIC